MWVFRYAGNNVIASKMRADKGFALGLAEGKLGLASQLFTPILPFPHLGGREILSPSTGESLSGGDSPPVQPATRHEGARCYIGQIL